MARDSGSLKADELETREGNLYNIHGTVPLVNVRANVRTGASLAPVEVKVAVQVDATAATVASPAVLSADLGTAILAPEARLWSHIGTRISEQFLMNLSNDSNALKTILVCDWHKVEIEGVHVGGDLGINAILGDQLNFINFKKIILNTFHLFNEPQCCVDCCPLKIKFLKNKMNF